MKLIKLKEDHYIIVVIVDDSEIKIGCIVAEKLVNGSYEMFTIHTLNDINSSCQNVITHSTQPLGTNEVGNDGFEFDSSSTYPPINVLPLSLSEVKELLGEVDMEKKAKESNDNHIKEFKSYPEIRYLHYGKGFISGYNQALEDNKDKKYTGEDVIRIVEKSRETGLTAEYLLLSLQPKTEWEVELVDGKLKLKS